ncbi:ATP-binding protein [Myceligenerans crystallogenes]|uniref:ATPase AAA-type core domain-containing protein n=1 Tax=Myceligenerans crystallogenes TaxID=316335 RepID=A0ABN2NCS3_9MICO
MSFFNTAGPCDPAKHYMLPAAERLKDFQALIDRELYMVLHAPRQTGKTTAIRALAKELTASGRYAALMFSCQAAGPAGDDYVAAQDSILGAIRQRAEIDLPEELRPPQWPDAPAANKVSFALSAWAKACPRPLVLFMDEIDSVGGRSLISVLRQIRDGYEIRPEAFPSSIVLCGLRDVRDDKAASGGDPTRLSSGSPFNIKAASLRLGDFTRDEIAELYAQHTADTGQAFTPEAVDAVWDATAGQPWLVNALAREIVASYKMGVPASEPITVDHVGIARERLIRARATHLDQLVDKLRQPRVERIIEPLITADLAPVEETFDDDVTYVRDLGLIAPDRPVRIANSIYREVISRVLTSAIQTNVERAVAPPRTFVDPDGRLNTDRLFSEFVPFWKQHGEILTLRDAYHEAALHLVLLGYLYRLVNGGGFVEREAGISTGRIDLRITWPYADAQGARKVQTYGIELKVRHPGKPDPLDEGMAQLDRYLDHLDQDTGLLAVFDRRKNAPPITERTGLTTATTPQGRTISLLRG